MSKEHVYIHREGIRERKIADKGQILWRKREREIERERAQGGHGVHREIGRAIENANKQTEGQSKESREIERGGERERERAQCTEK